MPGIGIYTFLNIPSFFLLPNFGGNNLIARRKQLELMVIQVKSPFGQLESKRWVGARPSKHNFFLFFFFLVIQIINWNVCT